MKLTPNLLVLAVAAMTFMVQTASSPQANDRPFWSEIKAFLKQDKIKGFERCRTLFVGSSSIRFWGSLQSDLPKRNMIRRGFGGAHLTHVIQYFDLLIERHQPSEIVLYAGENDISNGRTPTEVLEDLKVLLRMTSQSLGATPVYFIAIKPSVFRWNEFETQTRANALVKNLAQSRDDLFFIDVVPLMLESGAPKRTFVGDGLHMNRQGYILWTQAVNRALARSDATPAARCQRKAHQLKTGTRRSIGT